MTDKFEAFLAAQREQRFYEVVRRYRAEASEWWNMTCGNRWAAGYVEFCEDPDVPGRPFHVFMVDSMGCYPLFGANLHDLECAVVYDAWRPKNRDPSDPEVNAETLAKIREAIVTGILPEEVFRR
ncbi:MAG: hypothetical protein ACREE2_14385 [Stellaceae bacterium]